VMLVGCAHDGQLSSEEQNSYRASAEKLNLESSFAFSVSGHDYYFVTSNTNNCSHIDGYKDDRLTYSFPYKQLEKLTGVYKSEIEISQKMNRALALIESFSPRMYVCPPLPPPAKLSTAKKIDDAVGLGLDFIIYGSMFAVVAPVAVPALMLDAHIEHQLHKKLLRVQLGASYAQVNELLGAYTKEEKVDGYVVQSFDIRRSMDSTTWKRLVFVYKDQKLIAYVWGLAR